MDFTPSLIENCFVTEKLFNQRFSYTYDDVIFLPHYIDFAADTVDRSTCLTHRLPFSLTLITSLMDTIFESAMASLGVIAIIHSNTYPSSQAFFLFIAKSRRVPILSDPTFYHPSAIANHDDIFAGSPFLLVTDSGTSKGKLLGYVAKHDWTNRTDKDL